MKKAIISCEVLYREVLDLVDGTDIDVVFLSQGLHNHIDCQQMKDEIQTAINELEEKNDYEYIILGYGLCGGGVEGLTAKKASLVINLVHDCIPLLTGSKGIEGNTVSTGSFYLSRGWIDCGGDLYKEYLFLTDQMEHLISSFNEYMNTQKDALISWPQKNRYDREKRGGRKYSSKIAEHVTYEYLKNYTSIILIDNDNLDPIHRQYGEEVYGFLNILVKKKRGKGLDYHVLKGDNSQLKKILFFENLEPEEQKEILIIPPGEKVKLKEIIL